MFSLNWKLFWLKYVVAKDTTAAGDVFNGALAIAIAENNSLDEAIQFANAAAAVSVTRIGAQPSAPIREEIEGMIKRCKNESYNH